MSELRVGGSTARSPVSVPRPPQVKTAEVAAAAGPAVRGVASRLQQDSFEAAPTAVRASTARAATGAAAVPQVASSANDKAYDGGIIGRGEVNAEGQRQVLAYAPGTDLAQVPGFEPRGGRRNDSTLIYVNGVGNDVFEQAKSMQALADVSGSRVVGVHNATEGQALDFVQAGLDKLLSGYANPAARSLRDTLLTEMRAGREVHLVGHSQGALITASALQQVKDYLNRPSWLGGPSGAEATALKERFNQIKVESYGGAESSWPQGPQYVHYVNPRDPVNLVGLPVTGGTKDLLANERPGFFDFGRRDLQQRAGGPGAVVNFVHDDRGGPLDGANHDFNAGYLYQRVDFDQARRGEFQDVQTRGRPVAGGPVETYDRDGGERAVAGPQRLAA